MSLKGEDYPIGSPVYTFVAPNGDNTHVDSEKLRNWCSINRSQLEIVDTPVDQRIAFTFLTDNVIDLAHAERVSRMAKLDPIIYGVTGVGRNGNPDVILIDGHHRYFCAAMLGCRWIPSLVLAASIWREFEIIGLPTLTEEQLRRAPIRKGGEHAEAK